MRLHYYRGNIVHAQVDAIVNAANPRMLGGGGVDGAIHRAAGPGLRAACREFPELEQGVRIRVGQVRTTEGFDLDADFVIHTAGPIFAGYGLRSLRPGERVEPRPLNELKHCIVNCLKEAARIGANRVAFPAISAGVYGGSVSTFAHALHEAMKQEARLPIEEVQVVLFQDNEFQEFSDWQETADDAPPIP